MLLCLVEELFLTHLVLFSFALVHAHLLFSLMMLALQGSRTPKVGDAKTSRISILGEVRFPELVFAVLSWTPILVCIFDKDCRLVRNGSESQGSNGSNRDMRRHEDDWVYDVRAAVPRHVFRTKMPPKMIHVNAKPENTVWKKTQNEPQKLVALALLLKMSHRHFQ